MDFKQFADYMKEEVARKTNKRVRLQQTIRNNSIVLCGMIIENRADNISPVIYLEPYYEMYQCGNKMESIVEKFLHHYNEIPKQSVDVSFLADFEKVKGRIVYKVISAEENKAFLEAVPHETILDLAKVYYIKVFMKDSANATITINNSMVKFWGVTEEELKMAAAKNTEKLLPIRISSMLDVMTEIFSHTEHEEQDEAISDITASAMYVVTNPSKMYGASAIFYENAFKQLAERLESDLYIIPSSVHELIAVPCEYGTVKGLNELIPEVNQTQLEAEEILSSHLYIYKRETNTIEIA